MNTDMPSAKATKAKSTWAMCSPNLRTGRFSGSHSNSLQPMLSDWTVDPGVAGMW